jgi:transmembrane sensor
MRKFTFRKNNSKTTGRAVQEKLVNEYFDELDLSNEPAVNAGNANFDADAVYNRIVNAIDNDPQINKRGSKIKWLAAAGLVAGVFISVVSYNNRYRLLDVIAPIAMNQIKAKNGQMVSITLGDGTKVWINGGSKLTYPENFRGELREITLEGEAFLDVAHDVQRPFIVHTGKIKTQVMGTSFNVKAYAEDDFVKVDVVTGKVGVVAPVGKAVFLTPAEEVVINKKDHWAIKTQKVDLNLLTGWKDGELVFKNMPLPEVLTTLQRRFNIELKADANLAKCFISANFTKVSLQNIMVIISRIVKGKAVQDKFGYRIKGKGC